MSETKRIESGDGDEITVSHNGSHVVVRIFEAGDGKAGIWLTPEQADELIREIAAARVELSKARPGS